VGLNDYASLFDTKNQRQDAAQHRVRSDEQEISADRVVKKQSAE
jgi:hypothetical protein